MKIEKASDKDFPAISAVWNETFRESRVSSRELESQVFGFGLDLDGIFCAREGGSLAGFAVATDVRIPFTGPKPLPGCIAALAVKKELRGRGAGGALLEKAQEYLKRRGHSRAYAGYPTYLRGTILSNIGVEAGNREAVRFFEKFSYAPKSAVDSMGRGLSDWEMPPGDDGGEAVFEALRPDEADIFLGFIEQEFPGSWDEQFRELSRRELLRFEEVLFMKKYGQPAGFAGPFHVAECGDTCGIGLGVAKHLRGRGLGLLLLYNMLDFVKELGAARITLFGAVDKANYYSKAGLEPGPVYLLMEKKL